MASVAKVMGSGLSTRTSSPGGRRDRAPSPGHTALLWVLAVALMAFTACSDPTEVYAEPTFRVEVSGEEFVVLLPDTGVAGATAVAEQIRMAFAELAMPHAASAAAPYVTVSAGVAATIPRPTLGPGPFIQGMDRMLVHGRPEDLAVGRGRGTESAGYSPPP